MDMETLVLDMSIPLLAFGLAIMVDFRDENAPEPGSYGYRLRNVGIYSVALLIVREVQDSLFWSSPLGISILLLFFLGLGLRQAIRSREIKPLEGEA